MAGINVDLGSQRPFASQSELEIMSDSKTPGHQVLAEDVSSTLSTQKPTIQVEIPAISPLSHVRMSNSATTVTVARRQLVNGESRPYSDYPLYYSSPSTAVNSRAPSLTKEIDAECEYNLSQQYRLKWRLASGFFAIFLGGWADGGKLISNGLITCTLTRRFHSDRDCHSMCVLNRWSTPRYWIKLVNPRSIERLQLDIHYVVFPFRGKYCRVCKLLPLATNKSSNSII